MEYSYINVAAGASLAGISVYKQVESGSAGVANNTASHHYIGLASLEIDRECRNRISSRSAVGTRNAYCQIAVRRNINKCRSCAERKVVSQLRIVNIQVNRRLG